MAEALPSRPNLRNLRNRAKTLLKAHRDKCAWAARDIRAQLQHFAQASNVEIWSADFTLLDAQLVIARRYGFANWLQLKRHIEERRGDNGFGALG